MCPAPNSLPSRSQQTISPEMYATSMIKKSQQQRPAAKKSVTFHGAVRVYPHLHINDFTPFEWSQAWYSDEEISEIKSECTLTVNLVKSGHLSMNDDENDSSSSRSRSWSTLCFRGLEFRTPEGAQQRRENKYMAWDRVLEEQDAQYARGAFDSDAIARKYNEVSFHCQAKAHALALDDARVVACAMRTSSSRVTAHVASSVVQINQRKTNSPSSSPRRRVLFDNVSIPYRHCSAAA
jgi:hypothetical protein